MHLQETRRTHAQRDRQTDDGPALVRKKYTLFFLKKKAGIITVHIGIIESYFIVLSSGENLLALLKKLASSPKLADPGLDKHGNMVFFDVVGYFMVHYPQRVGVIINCALVAAVMFKVIRKVLGMSSSGMVNVLKL